MQLSSPVPTRSQPSTPAPRSQVSTPPSYQKEVPPAPYETNWSEYDLSYNQQQPSGENLRAIMPPPARPPPPTSSVQTALIGEDVMKVAKGLYAAMKKTHLQKTGTKELTKEDESLLWHTSWETGSAQVARSIAGTTAFSGSRASTFRPTVSRLREAASPGPPSTPTPTQRTRTQSQAAGPHSTAGSLFGSHLSATTREPSFQPLVHEGSSTPVPSIMSGVASTRRNNQVTASVKSGPQTPPPPRKRVLYKHALSPNLHFSPQHSDDFMGWEAFERSFAMERAAATRPQGARGGQRPGTRSSATGQN
jgi:hypothetical protein